MRDRETTADAPITTAALPPRSCLIVVSLLALSQLQCVRAITPPPSVDSAATLESRVHRELNLARTRPDVLADYLEGWLSQLEGTELRRPGRRLYTLHEGRPAVEEAIRFLRQARPLPPLTRSSGMSRGAGDLVEGLGPSGGLSHVGLDGSGVGDRLSRYGIWRLKAAEVIQCGTADPREIVALLIVNDGVAERPHRAILFDPDYRVMGVAVGLHRRYQQMCVITLAGGYLESVTADASNGRWGP